MDKKQADKIKDVMGEIVFCETKLDQLRAELEALTGVAGKAAPATRDSVAKLKAKIAEHDTLIQILERRVDSLCGG